MSLHCEKCNCSLKSKKQAKEIYSAWYCLKCIGTFEKTSKGEYIIPVSYNNVDWMNEDSDDSASFEAPQTEINYGAQDLKGDDEELDLGLDEDDNSEGGLDLEGTLNLSLDDVNEESKSAESSPSNDDDDDFNLDDENDDSDFKLDDDGDDDGDDDIDFSLDDEEESKGISEDKPSEPEEDVDDDLDFNLDDEDDVDEVSDEAKADPIGDDSENLDFNIDDDDDINEDPEPAPVEEESAEEVVPVSLDDWEVASEEPLIEDDDAEEEIEEEVEEDLDIESETVRGIKVEEEEELVDELELDDEEDSFAEVQTEMGAQGLGSSSGDSTVLMTSPNYDDLDIEDDLEHEEDKGLDVELPALDLDVFEDSNEDDSSKTPVLQTDIVDLDELADSSEATETFESTIPESSSELGDIPDAIEIEGFDDIDTSDSQQLDQVQTEIVELDEEMTSDNEFQSTVPQTVGEATDLPDAMDIEAIDFEDIVDDEVEPEKKKLKTEIVELDEAIEPDLEVDFSEEEKIVVEEPVSPEPEDDDLDLDFDDAIESNVKIHSLSENTKEKEAEEPIEEQDDDSFEVEGPLDDDPDDTLGDADFSDADADALTNSLAVTEPMVDDPTPIASAQKVDPPSELNTFKDYGVECNADGVALLSDVDLSSSYRMPVVRLQEAHVVGVAAPPVLRLNDEDLASSHRVLIHIGPRLIDEHQLVFDDQGILQLQENDLHIKEPAAKPIPGKKSGGGSKKQRNRKSAAREEKRKKGMSDEKIIKICKYVIIGVLCLLPFTFYFKSDWTRINAAEYQQKVDKAGVFDRWLNLPFKYRTKDSWFSWYGRRILSPTSYKEKEKEWGMFIFLKYVKGNRKIGDDLLYDE